MLAKTVLVIKASVRNVPSTFAPQYSDQELQLLFGKSSIKGLGVTSFWHQATFGHVTFNDALIWNAGTLNTDYVAPSGPDAGWDIVSPLLAARTAEFQAYAAVADFIVVMMAANYQAFYAPGDALAHRGAVIVHTEDIHSAICHEVGHALLLSHSWGPDSLADAGVDAIKMYNDNFCVMGRNSSGGFRQDLTLMPRLAPSIPPPPNPQRKHVWSGVGPRPSAATLARSLPGFLTTSHVRHIGTSYQANPQTITIRSAESPSRAFPAVIGLTIGTLTSGFETLYLEYRTNSGCDDHIDHHNDPLLVETLRGSGIVIHRDYDWTEVSPSGTTTAYHGVRLVGHIPLPTTGDLDWRSPHADLSVTVLSHTDTTATLRVGRRVDRLQPAVLLDVTQRGIEVDPFAFPPETGFDDPPEGQFLCASIKGPYGYSIIPSPWEVQAVCSTVGLTDPTFNWFIDDDQLPAYYLPQTVKPAAAFEVPHQPSAEWVYDLAVRCSTNSGIARLRSDYPGHRHSNGSFEIRVDVAAVEGTFSARQRVNIRGADLVWERRYRDDWDRCIPDLFDGPFDPLFFDPGDPAPFDWDHGIRSEHARWRVLTEHIRRFDADRAEQIALMVAHRFGT